MPASPPQVSYQRGGGLTIVANNSTLGDILSAVRARTGAVIEGLAGTAGERVVARIGPGPPREVLAALLNGSRFDYIILGSIEDPNAVRRVILTPKQGAGAPPTSASAPAAASVNPPPATGKGIPLVPGIRPRTLPEENEEQEVMGPEEAPEVQEESPQPPPAQTAPGAPPQVKTPEQLLQELQKMQQQEQQQQQQQQRQE